MKKNEVLLIDPTKIMVNPRVSQIYSIPENYEEIKISINNSGIREPLIVGKDGFIISGSLRHKIALEIGFNEVPIIYSEESSDHTLTVVHNQQRIKKCSEILNEYELLKQKYSIKQGSRTDLNDGLRQQKESLVKSLPMSKSKLSRLSSINRMVNDLYGKEDEKSKKIWDDIDGKVKSVDSVYKSLLNKTKKKANKSVVPDTYELISENVKIYNKSCESMTEVESNSIACIISSPPYYNMRNYGNGVDERGAEKQVNDYINGLVNDYEDCRRVLKDDGSLWVNINDCVKKSSYNAIGHRFVLAMIASGWNFNDELIWIKGNPTYSFGNRSVRAHEYIFHFTKSKEFYYDDSWMQSEIENCQSAIYGYGGENAKLFSAIDFRDGVLKTNIANIEKFRKECKENKGFNLTHSATFPLEVPTICILSSSKPGDTILDCHNGISSSGESALLYGRSYVGYELNPEFIMASGVRLSKYLLGAEKLAEAA
jgi:site-specific DNA-methyltransferase (adenine-specific)